MEEAKPLIQKVRLSEAQAGQVTVHMINRTEFHIYQEVGYVCVSKLCYATFLEISKTPDWLKHLNYYDLLEIHKSFDAIIKLTCDIKPSINGIYLAPYLIMYVCLKHSPELAYSTWEALKASKLLQEGPTLDQPRIIKEDTLIFIKTKETQHFEILILSYNNLEDVLEDLGYTKDDIVCLIGCIKDPYHFLYLIKRNITYLKVSDTKARFVGDIVGDVVRDLKFLFLKHPSLSILPRKMALENMLSRDELRAFTTLVKKTGTTRNKTKAEMIGAILDQEGLS